MAKSLTAANKQIDRLKAKLEAMKEAAKAPKAPRATLAKVKRQKNIQARIDAANAVIADLQDKMAKGDVKPATAAKMEARIDKLRAMILQLQKEAKPLTVYNVRLMRDEAQVGEFGPYATIRAASADAKNILRMHVGPDNKIEEVGVDEPLLRSDGKIMAYFHPSIYASQSSDGPVLAAQVVETGGIGERTATFVDSVKAKKKKKKKATGGGTQTSLLNPRRNGRASALEADAHAAGYHLATYSPGDGKTRYRFFPLAEMARRGVSAREQDYFGPLSGGHTVMGLAAAKKWLAHAPSLPRTNRRRTTRR